MPFIQKTPLEYPINTADSIRRWLDIRSPTLADYKQFRIGDLWNDSSSQDWWILCHRNQTQGIWRKLAGTSAATEFFTPDVGGQVGPDALNNINIGGGGGLTVTGNPATFTLTIAPTGGGSIVESLTGNIGGAVGPDPTATINIVGTATNGINVTGNPVTFTQTISMQSPYADGDFAFTNTAVATARSLSVTNTDVNVASDAYLAIVTEPLSADPFIQFSINATQQYSLGVDNSDADNFKLTDNLSPSLGNVLFQMTTAGVPSFPTAPLGVPSGGTGVTTITANAIVLGNGVNPINEIGPLTDGQLIIGSTGLAPTAATLTSIGGTIAITNGAGSINLETGGAVATSYLTDDTNSAIPALGVLTVAGGNNIYTSSAGSTVTIDVNGTTDHTVQVGNATGSLTSLAAATNGQLIIGSTGADPAVAALASADGSVTITNGAGTIDLSAAGVGFLYEEITAATKTIVINYEYGANRAGGVAFALPAAATIGTRFAITGMQGLWSVTQGAGQQAHYGNQSTTAGAGGSLTATNAHDCIHCTCTVADTTWTITSSVGNITIA